ncbi:Triose-phosphate Transporter family, putative [Angomonas deanei]|uniref:Triose-phosphate Transporter family, putative n=1 Tax=Angomonas deanei TaxID=59799 RepID=A0A7G2C7W2_9TRYP|nr:Triose-phosphate Transporter family, putative [Angomonas deanei]
MVRIKNLDVEVAVSLMAYSLCSVSMIILNKMATFSYNLRYPNAILFLQNAGALLLVVLAKKYGFVDYPAFSMAVAKRWFPLTLLFIAMLFTSFKSLDLLSVTVQTVLKNTALILTALCDKRLYAKHLTPGMYVSFVLLVFGGVFGAKGDTWATVSGVLWTLANVVITTCYTLYMKALTKELGDNLGRYGPVFYNNLLSLPILFIFGLVEFPALGAAVQKGGFGAMAVMVVMTAVCSGMTFCVFRCISITSPTTFSVMGAFNKIPISFLGIILFHQYPTPLGYLGLVISIAGSSLYTYESLKSGNAGKPKSDAPPLREDKNLV